MLGRKYHVFPWLLKPPWNICQLTEGVSSLDQICQSTYLSDIDSRQIYSRSVVSQYIGTSHWLNVGYHFNQYIDRLPTDYRLI